jgi:8-oxo-dGTP pyrophosphatase MutT (NUDIX family)
LATAKVFVNLEVDSGIVYEKRRRCTLSIHYHVANYFRCSGHGRIPLSSFPETDHPFRPVDLALFRLYLGAADLLPLTCPPYNLSQRNFFFMSRTRLLQQLSDHRPFNEHEAAMLEAMRDFVATNPNCFERSLATGHLTGSAWILDRAGHHVLLTHHRKLNRWLQLGGHADGDPNLFRVALREAVEESGLQEIKPLSENIFDVDVHNIPERGAEPAHFHYDVRFLFEADRRSPLIVSSESKALAWTPLDDLSRLNTDQSVLRLAAKTVQLQNVTT